MWIKLNDSVLDVMNIDYYSNSRAFDVEIARQNSQLNGNILPLSDVIAFTHVEKLKCVHIETGFKLLLCMLVCFFSLPAVFFFRS